MIKKREYLEDITRNRRRYERVAITSTALITVLRDGSVMAPFGGLIMNISFGGVGICAMHAVELCTDIEVALKFVDIDGEMRQETIQGQVAWQTEMPPFYVFGVQFNGLNVRDHSKLMRYLEAQKKEYII